MPILASASIFSSLIGSTAVQSSASGSSANSQNVVLPSPVRNPDPHPNIGGGDINVVGGVALLAIEGPSGTAADVESAPSNQQVSVYTVREGDTLSGIAKMFDVTVNTILGANDIKGGVVHPGQVLIIFPIPGLEHTVAKGETLNSLAKTYHSDAHDIASYNGLADGADLMVGDQIFIPGGETPTVAQKPATSGSKASSSQTKKISNIASGKSSEPYLGGSGPALAGYFSWPLAGGVITQGLHGWNAVDIGAPKGTSIYAAAGGTVIVANGSGAWNGGYGSYVVIQHPNGTQTLYAHMSKVLVSPGDSVSQGDIIGKVGTTGESTGPHLHFEVRGAANPFAN
ncbi:MAG TPA: peptidoglycan DD-metalloendopeptidase family protein [Candidatus Paceibacterota bacterium]|nr:peptidoglycan DD-metalloendopeptidase family protein [Candidatus Paceibacterota bacterium]